MALYDVVIKSSAGKELEAVGTRADRIRIVARIRALANEPRPQGSEKLAGHGDRHRVRQGNYRIVHAIDESASSVVVFRIGHRRDVYR